MAGRRSDAQGARETRNEGLEQSDERLHDPKQRTPRQAVDRTAGERGSPAVPGNADEKDVAQLENPPQVIGPRERSNDAV